MRNTAAALAALLIFVACGGRQEAPPVAPDHPSGATRDLQLPDPQPAIAAYRVRLKETVPDAVREKIEDLDGVALAAAVATERFEVRGSDGTAELTVGSARPLRFRSVAPASTKEADFVWAALVSGRAVLTFDAAKRLGIETSGRLQIGNSETIPVGAFAANGSPDIADVLVADHIGRALGMGAANLWVVAADEPADIDALGPRLRKALASYDVAIEPVLQKEPAELEPAGQPQPVGHAEGTVIGSMSFRILKDGFIDPDPAWEAANIATGEVALLGTVTCHRLVFAQLHAAMTEIAEAGLASEVDPDDYGGCYVPRFIDRNPKKPLSMHAFGLAFDINVSENYLGTRGDQHPKVVEILERWGFAWGGSWDRPDPMHFEMVRLVQT